MNVYRMLEILGEQNQFELLEGENGFHTPQDIRLVYLMNDAAECFLTFRNARITGEYLPDYSGELGTRLDRNEERSSLVVHQGHNVFTIFFEKLELEYELYNYGEIGHFWVKGYEYLRQLEYRIAILWDKYEYMGEDCCSETEQKLAWLAKFPPLNFTSYPSVPPQYLPDREDGWQLAPEALEVMTNLAKEARRCVFPSRAGALRKTFRQVDDKVHCCTFAQEEARKGCGSADREAKASVGCPSLPELWTGAGCKVCTDHEGGCGRAAGLGRKGNPFGSPSGRAVCTCL